jgi:chromosome segregation ATPase
MIPPIAPSLLHANPKFEVLHARLLKDVLDFDASTRSLNNVYDSDREKLDSHRQNEARNRILCSTLFASGTSDEIPSDLQHLILSIASYISEAAEAGLTLVEHDLMQEDAEIFTSSINEIAQGVSRKLVSDEKLLSSIAALAPARSQHSGRLPSELPLDLQSSVDNLITRPRTLRNEALPAARYETINALISLLKTHAEYLQKLIRHLERRKYGAEGRHFIARTQFLSTVAQGLEGKTKTWYLEEKRDLYSLQLRQKLLVQAEKLRQEDRDMELRRQNLEAALAEYEDVGGEVMRALGDRYGEIEERLKEVKKDVETLEAKRTPAG